MEKILLGDLWFEPYISRTEIDRATTDIAARIVAEYATRPERPILLVTMNGAMLWAAQLVHKLGFDTDWAFVKCASYGSGLTTSGEVRLAVEPCIDVAGRDVIVIEDIVDSGHTWLALHKYLTRHNAASVKIAAMVIKRDAYKADLPVDYVGIEVENKFIVGNGLDYDQRGRHLRDLYILCQ